MRLSTLLAATLLLPAVSACSHAQTAPAGAPAPAADAHLEVARRVLRAVPLVDGHNDLPWAVRGATRPHDVAAYDLRTRTPGHTDLPRL